MNEPEYIKAEWDAMSFNNVGDESESKSSSKENFDSSHLENIHWYRYLPRIFNHTIKVL